MNAGTVATSTASAIHPEKRISSATYPASVSPWRITWKLLWISDSGRVDASRRARVSLS